MKIKNVMTQGAELIAIDATVKQAAERMRTLNVGALPVKSDSVLKGIITDRDITVRAIADGKNPNEVKVNEIMSENIAACKEEDDIEQTADLMKEKQLRRLVVTDDDNQIVGMISIGDLCTKCNPELAGDVVKEVSEPSTPER
jgi:CBS domain-containing protein